MLGFCFVLIFTVTFIKTQKPIPVKLIEDTNWPLNENLTKKIKTLTNHEKILENGEKTLVPQEFLNLDEDYRKSLDSELKENSKNQSNDKDQITSRFYQNRAHIDGGGNHFNSRDTIAKTKHDSFESVSSDIPLTDTFWEQFSEKRDGNDCNDNHERIKKQNKLSVSAKKENDVPDGRFKITENDAVAVQFVDEKFQTSKLHPPQSFPQSTINDSSKSHTSTNTKRTILKNNMEKTTTSMSGRFQSNDSIPIEKQTEMTSPKENQTQNTIFNTKIESQHKSEENYKKQIMNSTNLVKFDLKPGESSAHSREEATYKNDNKTMNLLARFRKQVLNWQNKAPISTSIAGVTGSRSNVQSQATDVNYINNLGFSNLPFRVPEPLSTYYSNNQKVTNYDYLPTRQPIKIAQQLYPSQNFQPTMSDQNSYLPDRPPPELEPFKRQDQATSNQFFSPGAQTYPSQQPLKNNSLYYASPNYYYPSVSYQPSRLPIEELTTQIYPPLGVPPSQTYQIPSYQYGPPQPSYTYGPPPKPTESLPIQEQKPYIPQSYSRIVLNDEQCVMSQKVMAEALAEIVLTLRSQGSQVRNCALMFSSDFNIAVTSTIQEDQNRTTVDLVRQLNLRMFSVQPKGFISEITVPWYMDNKSTGLTFGSSGSIIITFQSNSSITFRLLVFSYKDITTHIPMVFNYTLVANATTPLNVPASMNFLPNVEISTEKMTTTQQNPELFNITKPQSEEEPATEQRKKKR